MKTMIQIGRLMMKNNGLMRTGKKQYLSLGLN